MESKRARVVLPQRSQDDGCPGHDSPAFSAGRPRVCFEGRHLASVFPLIGVAYDVSPDGQRFLMIKEAEQSPSATQVVVVQNWTEELKRLAPSN